MLTAIRTKFSRLQIHTGFRLYASNTLWVMGEKVLRMFVGLFVGIWVVRYLGPEKFGLFSYIQSFVFLFSAIATLGLDGIVVRELVKDETRRDELLGTAFGMKLIGALTILPILWVVAKVVSGDSHTTLLMLIVACGNIFRSFNVIDFYYQSKVQSKYVAWGNSIALGLSSVIKIALIINEAPLVSFVIMVAFDALVLAIALFFFYKTSSHEKISAWSFKTGIAKKIIKESWPLILSGLVVSVYMKIDQVMIKEMLDTESVGQYAAAVRLTEVWYFIPVVIANSVYPAIVSAKNKCSEIYLNRMQKLYDFLVWVAIFLAAIFCFFSDSIISLLYGVEYLGAVSVLEIYFWSAVFSFIGVASSKWFITEKMQIYSFYRTLAGVVVNIAMNFLLIPSYGIAGAAVATLISQFVASYLFNSLNSKVRVVFMQQTKAFVAPIRYARKLRV